MAERLDLTAAAINDKALKLKAAAGLPSKLAPENRVKVDLALHAQAAELIAAKRERSINHPKPQK